MPRAPTVISVLAVIVAVAHTVFPDLAIDTTTLLLLGIAALPWLAPILKSFKLPGGVEVVLRDIETKIDHVQARVHENAEQVQQLAERVERYIFSGDTSPSIEQQVSVLLNDFRTYLLDLGLDVPPAAPSIRIDRSLTAGYYDGMKGEMVLGSDLASDWMVLRQYCNHVLSSKLGGGQALSAEASALRSGLAYYFPCSYKDLIPDVQASLEGAQIMDILRPLSGPTDSIHRELAVGVAWMRLLWKVRDRVGKRNTDRAIAVAWANVDGSYLDFANEMLSELNGRVEAEALDDLRAIFAEAGMDSGRVSRPARSGEVPGEASKPSR
jgi:hypothetical protein